MALLNKLLALLALAFTWAHLVGIWFLEQRPFELRNYGHPKKSLCRSGSDALRSAILASPMSVPVSDHVDAALEQ